MDNTTTDLLAAAGVLDGEAFLAATGCLDITCNGCPTCDVAGELLAC
jgi:hypothetical protein